MIKLHFVSDWLTHSLVTDMFRRSRHLRRKELKLHTYVVFNTLTQDFQMFPLPTLCMRKNSGLLFNLLYNREISACNDLLFSIEIFKNLH